MSNSNLASLKVGVQSAKDSVATDFICGNMKVSGFDADWVMSEDTPEHGCGNDNSSWRDKSQRARLYYTVPGAAEAWLYPEMFGVWLRGLGFEATTSGTTAKTHVFELADAADDPYLSLITDIKPDIGGALERLALNARVTQLKLSADKNGVGYSVDFAGLEMEEATGSETSTTEPKYKLLQSSGSYALRIDPTGANVALSTNAANPPRGLEMTITNDFDKEDVALWSPSLATADRKDGVRVEGALDGLLIDWDSLYKRLQWGGTSGTEPSATWLPCSLSFTFQSAQIITGSTKYSLQISQPTAEVWIDPQSLRASGNNPVRKKLPFRFFGGGMTATLVNTLAAYA